ncbi:MAG: protein-glutamate O-methyltransferase CheR [Bdellovibrionales bacterium]|nr:protein-glutamate O-methyltransferase CheR [Bdellovibrionales bacterium]
MALEEQDFLYVSKMVREESAIVLEKGKEYLVESRLSPLAQQDGYASIKEMVQKLRETGELVLKLKIVDALTTNETSFFRDLKPFEMLQKELLPELIEKRKDQKRLEIWCAAASTGQEIYTICMTIRENFPWLRDWNVRILGTDINQEVLDKARRGVYSQIEVNRGLPATMLIKYFEKSGIDWKIKDDLKSMTEFRKMNLIKPWGSVGRPDVIFMRNVLIYFDTDTKKEILGKVRNIMQPDGFLFLGAAETTLNLDENYVRRTYDRGGCYTLKGKDAK